MDTCAHRHCVLMAVAAQHHVTSPWEVDFKDAAPTITSGRGSQPHLTRYEIDAIVGPRVDLLVECVHNAHGKGGVFITD